MDTTSAIVESLVKAHKELKGAPLPSKIDKDFNIDKAYQVQEKLVAKINNGKIKGYKLSPKGVDDPSYITGKAPVFGYVFDNMVYQSGAILDLSKSINMFLEPEIGFVIGEDIDGEKLSSIEELKKYIKSVVPAIEAFDAKFSSLDGIKGEDIAANNGCAHAVILGKEVPLGNTDVDSLKAQLACNNEVVVKGDASFIDGSPFNVLYWLAKELPKHGKNLKAGQFVITGGVGGDSKAKISQYKAVLEGLGEVAVTIK